MERGRNNNYENGDGDIGVSQDLYSFKSMAHSYQTYPLPSSNKPFSSSIEQSSSPSGSELFGVSTRKFRHLNSKDWKVLRKKSMEKIQNTNKNQEHPIDCRSDVKTPEIYQYLQQGDSERDKHKIDGPKLNLLEFKKKENGRIQDKRDELKFKENMTKFEYKFQSSLFRHEKNHDVNIKTSNETLSCGSVALNDAFNQPSLTKQTEDTIELAVSITIKSLTELFKNSFDSSESLLEIKKNILKNIYAKVQWPSPSKNSDTFCRMSPFKVKIGKTQDKVPETQTNSYKKNMSIETDKKFYASKSTSAKVSKEDANTETFTVSKTSETQTDIFQQDQVTQTTGNVQVKKSSEVQTDSYMRDASTNIIEDETFEISVQTEEEKPAYILDSIETQEERGKNHIGNNSLCLNPKNEERTESLVEGEVKDGEEKKENLHLLLKDKKPTPGLVLPVMKAKKREEKIKKKKQSSLGKQDLAKQAFLQLLYRLSSVDGGNDIPKKNNSVTSEQDTPKTLSIEYSNINTDTKRENDVQEFLLEMTQADLKALMKKHRNKRITLGPQS